MVCEIVNGNVLFDYFMDFSGDVSVVYIREVSSANGSLPIANAVCMYPVHVHVTMMWIS